MKFLFYLVAYLVVASSSHTAAYQGVKSLKKLHTIGNEDYPLPYVLVPYRLKNLWGFSDVNGNMKIAPQYDDVKQIQYYWTNGLSFQSVMVVSKAGNIFAINHLNQTIVPIDGHYDDITLEPYDYGVVAVIKQGKQGLFYDRKQIIPCQYERIEHHKNLSFRVALGGKSGIINSKGKIIVPVNYYGIRIKNSDKEHVTWVAGNDKNKNDEFKDDLVVDPGKQNSQSYTTYEASPATLNMSQANQDTMVKNIRKMYPGAIMDQEYSYLFHIQKNGKWGIFNTLSNKQTIPCQYDELKVEKNTKPKIAIRVKKGGLYGYIDEDNNVLAPLIFNAITAIYGNFNLHRGQNVGLLNNKLKYISPKYLSIQYSDGVYDAVAAKLHEFYRVVTVSGHKGYIDSNGFEYFKD
jgi:hypothetical protein